MMMRILLIHPEAKYFGGAETMLRYFLSGLDRSRCEVAVAVAPGGAVEAQLPAWVRKVCIPDNATFSLANVVRQAGILRRFRKEFDYQVVHGWAARDWELTALVGWLARRPTAGTLHDHPASHYIRGRRQALMRACANWGLTRVICVSEAVRGACLEAGYRATKLTTIHNGLPGTAGGLEKDPRSPLRLGYMGRFTEAKGFHLLFKMLEELNRRAPGGWEVRLAGTAPDSSAEALVAQIAREFGQQDWWKCVHWDGWTDEPLGFLRALDVLIFPSTQFDSFPGVLLEAGQVGVPALATRVGGVPEIVEDHRTGWLFEPEDWRTGGAILADLVRNPAACRIAGRLARDRIQSRFKVENMVAEHLKLYSILARHV